MEQPVPPPDRESEPDARSRRRRLALHVTPAAERRLRQGHPWLFDRSITRQSHEGEAGDLAVIFDRRRDFLAVGLYDPAAPIRVRVLQHRRPAPIDSAWFTRRVAQAVARREPLAAAAGDPARRTTGYRLVHGGNDGLPGLVIDRYATTAVIKLYSGAWLPHLPVVVVALLAAFPAERILLRLSRHVQAQGAGPADHRDGQLIWGEPLSGPVLFQENGLTFEADPVAGQKTGFFLDQRDNRQRVEDLAADRQVLDLFACSGAFSLYAARGGASRVVSIDRSQGALAAAQRNFRHNRAQVQAEFLTIVGDVFQTLPDMQRTERRFDMVILDPPAMAKRRDEVDRALSAYERLTRLALALLAPGGVLVMASCSSRIGADTFYATVNNAAREARRPLTEIARTGHALDHPIGFPEGAYLKCLFAYAAVGP